MDQEGGGGLGFNGIITEIFKKFGVHSCSFQSTAGDQYPGGVGAKIRPPPLGPDRVKSNLTSENI